MKNLSESINFVNEAKISELHRLLSKKEKKNFELIGDLIDDIASEVSEWSEDNDVDMDSDTVTLARQLSNLAAQLRGEWDEPVEFKWY